MKLPPKTGDQEAGFVDNRPALQQVGQNFRCETQVGTSMSESHATPPATISNLETLQRFVIRLAELLDERKAAEEAECTRLAELSETELVWERFDGPCESLSAPDLIECAALDAGVYELVGFTRAAIRAGERRFEMEEEVRRACAQACTREAEAKRSERKRKRDAKKGVQPPDPELPSAAVSGL